MIGPQSKSFLLRSLQQQQRYGALVQAGSRGFAGGGPKKAKIDPNCTDFDVVLVGKLLLPSPRGEVSLRFEMLGSLFFA